LVTCAEPCLTCTLRNMRLEFVFYSLQTLTASFF
jgi:hypothetical protein